MYEYRRKIIMYRCSHTSLHDPGEDLVRGNNAQISCTLSLANRDNLALSLPTPLH